VDSDFFDSATWRAFDFELRPLLVGGKISVETEDVELALLQRA
jgi:hypothetical protein